MSNKLWIIASEGGWVHIGEPVGEIVNRRITLRNVRCIIRWGTDAGLLQLKAGPRNDTALGEPIDATLIEGVMLQFETDPGLWP